MVTAETPTQATGPGKGSRLRGAQRHPRLFGALWLAVTSCAVTAHQLYLLNP